MITMRTNITIENGHVTKVETKDFKSLDECKKYMIKNGWHVREYLSYSKKLHGYVWKKITV